MKFKKLLELTIEKYYSRASDDGYASLIKHLKPLYTKDIRKIYYQDIEDLKNELSKNLKNSTINSILTIISTCYKFAKRNPQITGYELISAPDIEYLNRKKDKKRTEPLLEDFKDMYLEYAKENNIYLYYYIIIAYGTLLRWSEIKQFADEYINFQTNIIVTPKSKGGQPLETLMNEDVKAALLAIRPDYFSKFSYDQVRYWFIKANKFFAQQGQPSARILTHSCRAGGVSDLLRKGVSKHVIKELTHHKNQQMVDEYANVYLPDVVQAYNLLKTC